MNPQPTMLWSRLVHRRSRNTVENVTVCKMTLSSRDGTTFQSGPPWPRPIVRTMRRTDRVVRLIEMRVRTMNAMRSSDVRMMRLLWHRVHSARINIILFGRGKVYHSRLNTEHRTMKSRCYLLCFDWVTRRLRISVVLCRSRSTGLPRRLVHLPKTRQTPATIHHHCP